MNRPEAHDVLRRWRTIADRYDPRRVLLGETWVLDLESLARFYGSGEDELHLALNVPFVFSTPGGRCGRSSNGPRGRSPPARGRSGTAPTTTPAGSRRGGATETSVGRERRSVILLTLRGTPLLYYGDEIGMPNVDVPRDRLMDPVGRRHWPEDPGRDKGRTPMQWTREGRFLGRRRRAVAPDGRRSLPQRRRSTRRPGLVPHRSAGT